MRAGTFFRVGFLLAVALVADVVQSMPTFWPTMVAAVVFSLFGLWQGSALLRDRVPDRRRRILLAAAGVAATLLLHIALSGVFWPPVSRDTFLHSTGNCGAPLATPVMGVAAAMSTNLATVRATWEDVCRVSKLGNILVDRPSQVCGAATRVDCFRDLVAAIEASSPMSEVGHLLMIAAAMVIVTKDAKEAVDAKRSPEKEVLLGASVDVLELTLMNVKLLNKAHTQSPMSLAYRRLTGKTLAESVQGTLAGVASDVETNLAKEEASAPEIVRRVRPRFESLRSEIAKQQ